MKLTPVSAMFRSACRVRSCLDVPGTGARCSTPVAVMAVAGIAGAAVAVAVGSPEVVMDAAKDLITVKRHHCHAVSIGCDIRRYREG